MTYECAECGAAVEVVGDGIARVHTRRTPYAGPYALVGGRGWVEVLPTDVRYVPDEWCPGSGQRAEQENR